VFKTEDELRTHLDIEHAQGGAKSGKIKANALLAFDYKSDSDEEREDGGNRGRGRGGRGRGGKNDKGR